MSIPRIPGYTSGGSVGTTIADLWPKPQDDFPAELWPGDLLGSMEQYPSGWQLVESHFFEASMHGGVSCVLIPATEHEMAIQDTTWIGRDLGTVSIWNDVHFDSGERSEDPPHCEFFVQARRASGGQLPEIEVAHPFLWYWDAFKTEAGYRYLNEAGREQDLVRFERSADAWRIEIRALELRTFLAASGRSAVIQVDHVLKRETDEFDRVDSEFTNEWAHLEIHILHDGIPGDRPAFSRLLGQYIIPGTRTSRVPRWEERRIDREFEAFIYGMDSATGAPLTHSCNPDELGTYFDKDGTRLHYLTPVYFKREVLQPYLAEPSRYRVSSSRLSCLDLWGVDIGFDNTGLVELYLGDIGRDLPSDEWGHWRTFNVPPEGRMDEGRFRRDFLNQSASNHDPTRDLRRARDSVNAIATDKLGEPLWRPIPAELVAEYESLLGPVSDDPAALNSPILTLTKVFVDGLNTKLLKRVAPAPEESELSLQLLQKYVAELGDQDVVQVFRDLQAFRSRGGVAHLPNSQSSSAAEALGIAKLRPVPAFTFVVARLSDECTESVS